MEPCHQTRGGVLDGGQSGALGHGRERLLSSPSSTARQASQEVGGALGLATGQILYDIEKFYDSVDLSVVVRVGYNVQYPLLQLALGILMHQAPRRIITEAGVSDLLWPKRSLIAGCSQAVDLSRLALWEVLEGGPRGPSAT
jgi:hypothetical protein